MKAKDLELETKLATKEEIERKKRIEDRQKVVKFICTFLQKKCFQIQVRFQFDLISVQ